MNTNKKDCGSSSLDWNLPLVTVDNKPAKLIYTRNTTSVDSLGRKFEQVVSVLEDSGDEHIICVNNIGCRGYTPLPYIVNRLPILFSKKQKFLLSDTGQPCRVVSKDISRSNSEINFCVIGLDDKGFETVVLFVDKYGCDNSGKQVVCAVEHVSSRNTLDTDSEED